ncbi:MAG: hypothetical protein JXR59_08600 [Desulfuromonadaceae bacterium]|nr:hypothetical protein [Desulfuromonadaceae bacterium]
MKKKDPLTSENYLGFFLVILTLMAFAVVVKSCNISGHSSTTEAADRAVVHEQQQR